MFAAWDTHATVLEEADKNFIAKQTFNDEGNAITLVKWRCDGITMDTMKQYIDDPPQVGTVINSRMTKVDLGEDDGCKQYHLKMNMPMILSNRSVVTTLYNLPSKDGDATVLMSSKGNEAKVASLSAEIGSDVVANQIINFLHMKPYDGGVEFKQALAMDPAGMIPSFIKTKMSGRMAQGLQLMVAYLKDGTIPEPVF